MKSKFFAFGFLTLVLSLFVGCTSSDDDSDSSVDLAQYSDGDYVGLLVVKYDDFPSKNSTENLTATVDYVSSTKLRINTQGGDYFTVSLDGTSSTNPSFDEITTASGIYSTDGTIDGYTSIGSSTATLYYTIDQPYSGGGTMTITFNGSYEIE